MTQGKGMPLYAVRHVQCRCVEDGQNKNRRQAPAIGAYLLLDRN